MKWLVLSFCFGILSSCGEYTPDWIESDYSVRKDKIHTALAQYVEDFTEDREKYQDKGRRPLEVRFSELEPPTVGQCYGSQLIYIDQSFWYNEKCEIRKKALIYHELGHCVLGLGHYNHPSLMTKKLMLCKIYEENWDNLVKSLFGVDADTQIR